MWYTSLEFICLLLCTAPEYVHNSVFFFRDVRGIQCNILLYIWQSFNTPDKHLLHGLVRLAGESQNCSSTSLASPDIYHASSPKSYMKQFYNSILREARMGRGVCTSMVYRMVIELLAVNLIIMQHPSEPGKERYAAFSFIGEQEEDDLHNNSRMGGRAFGRDISLLVAYTSIL